MWYYAYYKSTKWNNFDDYLQVGTNELIDSPMDRSAIPIPMTEATNVFLSHLYPNKERDINKEFKYIVADRVGYYYSSNHRFIKKTIERYVSGGVIKVYIY